jgi:molybdate transport system ATP-binding protein
MAGSRVVAFDEVLDLLGLEKLLDRSPQNLSGGERQRVAIGRALLSQPKLLLMDEPLSALDRLTKDEILPFLERLHERLSLPVIYISHDMTELERLADHLILMRAGAVIAVGPLNALQSDPSLPLAVARDAAVSFNGTTIAYDANFGILTLQIDGGQLFVPSLPTPTAERRRVRIAAGDVSLSLDRPKTSSILNVLPARIVSNAPVGQNEIIVVLALTPTLPAGEGGARLLARITRRSWEQLGLREGMPIFAQVKGVSLALK